ncbi:conserved hypothetical protein [Mesorhizobium prunaredense]|uniref:Uncharacterized protein n=1 Tax=Mesorhizobium prunaredense TaxID=1631249 RepID=A0A1R3VKZ5_9HYPH|nr:conserved hypothetical protein [Mesorhizobium prunaredense]
MISVGAAPSSACRHLLPVNGEKPDGHNLGTFTATLEIGEILCEGVLLPVTIRGEVPGRAMRGGAGFDN